MSIPKAEAMERIRNAVRAKRLITVPLHANSVDISLPPRVTVLARRRVWEKSHLKRKGALGKMAVAMHRNDHS